MYFKGNHMMFVHQQYLIKLEAVFKFASHVCLPLEQAESYIFLLNVELPMLLVEGQII
jgi:hypothetical protein